jgi:hypothetical protein
MLLCVANHFPNVNMNNFYIEYENLSGMRWDRMYLYILYPGNINGRNAGYQKTEPHGSILEVQFTGDEEEYSHLWKGAPIISIKKQKNRIFISMLPGNLLLLRMGPVYERNKKVEIFYPYCKTLDNPIVDACNCIGVEDTCAFWKNNKLTERNYNKCVCDDR